MIFLFLCMSAAGHAWAQAGPGAGGVPDASDSVREKGLRALADGIDDAALRFFTEYRDAARQQEPAFSDATALLARTCLRQKNVKAADDALNYYRDNAKFPATPEAQESLAYWRAAVLLARNQWAEAQTALTPLAAGARSPEYRCLALEGLGDSCVHQKKWPEAEAAYNRILAEFPESDNANRARLANIKIALASGQMERAGLLLDDLEKRSGAVGLTSLYRIALLLNQNNWQDAWTRYKEAEAKFPPRPGADHWLVASLMATVLIANQQFSDALGVLERSAAWAESAADRIRVRQRIVECLIALGRTEAAITALEAFKKEFPDALERIGIELKLADLLRQGKSFLTAGDYYGAVAENDKAPADLRYRAAYNRAICYREAGQFANASQAFSRAAKLGQTEEQQAESLFLAGDAAVANANYTSAALLYQSVADSFPATAFAEKARFNQGMARAKEGQFSSAAMIFKAFLEAYPKSSVVPQAWLERGVALKNAGDFAPAVIELRAFVQAYGTNALAPQALIEAQQAAFGAGNIKQGVEILSQLLTAYPDSALVPTAIYQRAHLQFLLGQDKPAVADCQAFLEKYPQNPLAADVLMWLGDHACNSGAAADGENVYLQIPSRFPESPLAPVALLEAAKSALRRQDQVRAASLAGQLFRDYATTMSPPILAKAEFLQGDLLASQGQFAEAMPHFTRVSELVPKTPLAAAANGRLGDMYYSLSDGKQENLTRAVALYQELVVRDGVPFPEKEKARYRLAKAYEKLGQVDRAIKEYLEIVYQYDLDVKAGKVRDWFYFARSGHDVGRLLVFSERFMEAARIYERLAAAGIPTSEEALAKAREIRAAHKLQD